MRLRVFEIAPRLALLVDLAFGCARAHASKVSIDASASRVSFLVHATAHSFTGIVEKWTLELTLPDDATTAAPDLAHFSADLAALKTGNTTRDREMLAWFDQTTHPKIEFVLTKTVLVSGDSYTAEGKLSIHGVTKNVVVPCTIHRSNDALTIHGDVTIDTRDFGLPIIHKFAFLTVAPEVKVTFDVTGKIEK